jgi:hypothetical protein
MMTHRRKHIAVFVLLIAVLCLATLFVSHQRQLKAEQQRQSAIAMTYKLFNAVKDGYSGDEYSSRYQVRRPDESHEPRILKRREMFVSVRRPDAELIPAIETALQTLAAIDPDNLLGCDRRYFFAMESALRRRLEFFHQRVESQQGEKTRGAEQLFDEVRRIDLANADVNALKPQKPPNLHEQRLFAVTDKLTGTQLSSKQLLEIAEAELDLLRQDLQHLEANVRRLNLAESLDEYAAKDEFYTARSGEILDQYKTLGPILRQSFFDEFYPYDVARVETFVKTQSHKIMARGSYTPTSKGGRVDLYHDRDVFDLKSLGFLTVHEYFPGHHFEHKVKSTVGVCPDEKASLFSSEAWSTYAEYLADEVGFFDDPARRLGWLDYRLIRVGRIFIDIREFEEGLSKEELRYVWNSVLPTRLHHVFDQEYERVLSPKSEFRRFRYQHLHYLLGYQTIQATKTRLQDTLGDDFDERKFHHILLTGRHSDAEVLYEKMKAGLEVEGDYPFDHDDRRPLVFD